MNTTTEKLSAKKVRDLIKDEKPVDDTTEDTKDEKSVDDTTEDTKDESKVYTIATKNTQLPQVISFFNRIKTPGGLLTVFLILIFLLWVLVPTSSGQTRMQLLWNTLLMKTSLNPVQGKQPGQGGEIEQPVASIPVVSIPENIDLSFLFGSLYG